MGKLATTFVVGQTVHHAKHGMGKIIDIAEEIYGGGAITCYVVTFERDKLTMRISTTGSGVLDMRTINANTNLNEVFKELNKKPRGKGSMWSRRERDLRYALFSGNLVSIAGVVRDLYGDTSYSALSIYEEAVQRLVAEIGVIRGVEEENAVSFINKHLNEKQLALPRTYEGVRSGGITPDILNAERHQVVRAAPPPSAMEVRLAAKPAADVAPPLKPSELVKEQEAKRALAPKPVPVLRPVVTPRAATPTPSPRTTVTLRPSPVVPAPPPRAPSPVVERPVAKTVPAPAGPAPETTASAYTPQRSPEDVATIAALKKALVEKEAANAALVTVNRSLEDQVEAANKAQQAAQERWQRAVSALTGAEATKRELEALRNQLTTLEAKLGKEGAEKAELMSERTALAQQLQKQALVAVESKEDALAPLGNLRKELGIAKRSLTMAGKRETRLHEEVHTLEAKLKAAEQSVEALQRAHRVLEAQRDEFRTQLIARRASEQTAATDANAEVAAARNKLVEAKEALATTERAHRVLVSDLERVTTERDDARTNIALLHDTLATLRRELGQKKTQATKAVQTIKRLKELLREAELAAKDATMTRAELERMDAARQELVRFIEQMKT